MSTMRSSSCVKALLCASACALLWGSSGCSQSSCVACNPGEADGRASAASRDPNIQSLPADAYDANFLSAGERHVMLFIVSIWREGEKDRAVDMFIEHAGQPVSPEFLLLTDLSESEFRVLGYGQQQIMRTGAMIMGSGLRGAARDVLDKGRAAAAAGDMELAELCFVAVERVGRAHADADLLRLWQRIGEGMLLDARSARAEVEEGDS